MKSAYDIIIRPIITEQSMEAVESKKYVFEVARSANKVEIRKAVEQIFGVKVMSVNTLNVQGKSKRMGVHVGKTAAMKKAVVRLTADSKPIELFEGMV
ncbi:MAG: 50S ribosomal protein L23 [Butyricicoccaceae bacterium]